MMTTVQPAVLIGLALCALCTLLLPILFLILWIHKTHARLRCAVAGMLVFPVFALGLETIPKYFLFLRPSPVSDYLSGHAWCYVLVGALLAGIFEECGRWLAFRFVLKGCDRRQDAVAYGIGHGGVESILLVGVTMISYLILALMLNRGMLPTEQADLLSPILGSLTPQSCLLAILERAAAMTAHIGFSLLVFAGVQRRRPGLIALSIVLHALVDVPAVLYQAGVLSLVICEVLILALAAGTIVIARRISL